MDFILYPIPMFALPVALGHGAPRAGHGLMSAGCPKSHPMGDPGVQESLLERVERRRIP